MKEPGEIYDSPAAYLEHMFKERGYLLSYQKLLAEIDLPFLRKYNELVELVHFEERALDLKTKELIFLSVLVTRNAPEEIIRTYVRKSFEAGASKEEIAEALELIFIPAGAPMVFRGFKALADELGIDAQKRVGP